MEAQWDLSGHVPLDRVLQIKSPRPVVSALLIFNWQASTIIHFFIFFFVLSYCPSYYRPCLHSSNLCTQQTTTGSRVSTIVFGAHDLAAVAGNHKIYTDRRDIYPRYSYRQCRTPQNPKTRLCSMGSNYTTTIRPWQATSSSPSSSPSLRPGTRFFCTDTEHGTLSPSSWDV